MTNNAIISEIINDLRAMSIDDRISKRFVLSKLRGFASLYIKRENDLMKLFKYSSLFTPVSCIKMLPANERECCDIIISKCKSYAKSEKRLPAIYTWRNGLVIMSLISLGGIEYREITPKEYDRILKREFIDKTKKYFWIEDGHIIIPDSEVEFVELTAYFENEFDAKLISECQDKTESNSCRNPYDDEFKCPGHLLAIIKDDTIKNLFNYYKRNIVDELSDLNSNNKTSPLDGKQ